MLGWLFGEAEGEETAALLRGATKVVSSRLTLIEVRRVIRRAVAERKLDEVSGGLAADAFARAAARWAVMEITRNVAERAEGSFPVEPVRTLDALHLASALAFKQALPDLQLLSTDDRVRRNCRRLGMSVVPDREPDSPDRGRERGP